MKLFFTYLFIFFTSIHCFANNDEFDSIVKVKTYWNVNDVKTYTFHTKETRETSDSFKQDEIAYRIKITIDDLYEDEMTVTWLYDTVKFNTPNFVNNPLYLINDVPVRFVINTDGRFLRYVDLENTIESFTKSAKKTEANFINQPDHLEKINQLITTYSTTENIVKIFEKDIRQFHLFFSGSTYTINGAPAESTSYMDNLFNRSPTPAKTFISLKEIAFTGTNYSMNAVQIADPEWLSNSWYNYLMQLSEKLQQEKPDEGRKKDQIIYTVNTTSRIKDNGWISYSIETKNVNFQDTNYTLTRSIELD